MTEFDGKFGNPLISASLVWDGGSEVRVPHQMGAPRADQMQGTPAEQLSELAGRVCYDSLGKGRPSRTGEVVRGVDPHTGEQIVEPVEGFHDHILKVGHLSVYEHFNFTVEIRPNFRCSEYPQPDDFAFQMLNRPGCFTWAPLHENLRITTNLRAVLEFDNFTHVAGGSPAKALGHMLRSAASSLAPEVVPEPRMMAGGMTCKFIPDHPILDEERWVSMFISGSRGMSHELVRHGDFTAISQRSTRFVDESESEWVDHPLALAYCDSRPDKHTNPDVYAETPVIPVAREQYRAAVEVLEPWLSARGIDKTSARKQARGAARGYLGNALYTELIFSASVAQWKRILRQRASVFADAEIREVAVKAFAGLLESRYAASFDGWSVLPSPDGIGFVVQEPI